MSVAVPNPLLPIQWAVGITRWAPATACLVWVSYTVEDGRVGLPETDATTCSTPLRECTTPSTRIDLR